MARMNCDRLAPFYQSFEYLFFGRSLEHRRCALLQEVAGCHSALVCGGGDGRFLARLIECNPSVEVDFVDASSAMVHLAERRVAAMGQSFLRRVRFHACDILAFESGRAKYDLVVTNFFLDCFSDEEIDFVVSRLLKWTLPEAKWLLSEFREADGIGGRLWTRTVIRALYAAFRLCTGLTVIRLPSYYQCLLAQRLYPLREEFAFGGLLCSSVWQTRRESGASQ